MLFKCAPVCVLTQTFSPVSLSFPSSWHLLDYWQLPGHPPLSIVFACFHRNETGSGNGNDGNKEYK